MANTLLFSLPSGEGNNDKQHGLHYRQSEEETERAPSNPKAIANERIRLATDRLGALAMQLVQAQQVLPATDYNGGGQDSQQAVYELEIPGVQIIWEEARSQGNTVGKRALQVLGPISDESQRTVSHSL